MTTTRPRYKLLVYRGDCLIDANLPKRDPIFVDRDGQPLLTMKSIVEVFGVTGVGKSMFTTALSLALASQSRFLIWQGVRPCRVLYIDGEMTGDQIQSRMLLLADKMGIGREHLRNTAWIGRDWHSSGIARFDTQEGQEALEPFLRRDWTPQDEQQMEDHLHDAKERGEEQLLASWPADVVVFDNTACLFDPLAEESPVAWQPGQEYLQHLKDRGHTAVLVQHAGRAGLTGRGHSSRDDRMDIIIGLTPMGLLDGITPATSKGCKFDLTLRKYRDGDERAERELRGVKLTPTGWKFAPPKDRIADFDVDLEKYEKSYPELHSELPQGTM